MGWCEVMINENIGKFQEHMYEYAWDVFLLAVALPGLQNLLTGQ